MPSNPTRRVGRPRPADTPDRPQPADRVVFTLDAPTAHVRTAVGMGERQDGEHTPRTRIRTQWTARRATPADAEALQIPVGTVVLDIRRTVTDANGQVIKATTTLCPGVRVVLHHSYRIAPAR